MHIRMAREDDLPAIVLMGTAFVAELPYGDTNPATAGPRIEARFQQVLKQGGVVLVGEDDQGLTGMLAVVFAEHPLVGTRMAFEVAWWVEPRARKGTTAHRLIHEAFDIAKRMDCERIQFGAPNAMVARLYSKLGMRAIEGTFIKEL